MANDNRSTSQKLAPAGGVGQTSVGNPQNYQAQQDALLQAAQRQQLADQRASEQLNRAAKNRPGGENDITNPIPGLKVQYTSLPPTSGSNSRARKGK